MNENEMRSEPEVIAADGARISYSDVRKAWEAGEFSGWVEQHGWPLVIDGDECRTWDEVESALSDDTWDGA